MADAFVISTADFTAGILVSQRRGLRFEASSSQMRSLQDRIFATPEAAERAVEQLVARKSSDSCQDAIRVSCRPLF